MTTTDKPPIDTATVQRCIELLKGTGEYRRVIHWDQPSRASETRETWTYTQHPMDLLAGLLKPEPTEAQKLVDAWLVSCGIVQAEDYGDFVRVAQFVLNNTKRDNPAEILRNWATDFAEEHGYTAKHESFDAAAAHAATPIREPEPQYTFGPWIEWHGGDCPVPGDWMVETLYRKETIEMHFDTVIPASEYNKVAAWQHNRVSSQHEITHYRVRFTVDQWYDWAGGECPVEKDVQVEVGLRNGSTNSTYSNPTFYRWTHGIYSPSDLHDIVKFRVIAP